MVAFANKITPTEVAYFLIQQFHNFSLQVEECRDKLLKCVKEQLQEKDLYFSKIHQQLMMIVSKYNHQKEKEISNLTQRLQTGVLQYLLKQQNALHQFQTKTELLHPENILKRGYSITMKNGKALRSVDEVEEGEIIVTKLFQGEIKSEVKNTLTS
jgi:exodeoxyribonuclease VII large subunit